MEKKKAILKIKYFSTTDGMLLLSAQDAGVRTMLKGLTDLCNTKYSGYMKIEASPPYKPRSLPENAKWWAMCTEYGNYCGMSKDDVAMGVKYRAMDEGLWESQEVPFSNGVRIPVSTTRADTKQMAVLIDVLYRIAAEDGYTFDEGE